MYGTRGGFNWFDEAGGEWRWHEQDSWHPVGHWDYNPWTEWNSEWQNIEVPAPPPPPPTSSSGNP
jgi:hypothetical protein